MKKTTTLLFIVSIFAMLTMTACGRECTCDCNCRSAVVDNSEIEATPEPTPESTPDPTSEPNESESESELELEQDEDEEFEKEEEEKEKAYRKEEKEKEKVYNEAKELYQSGKWDGDKPMTLHSRTVSLNSYGDILVNDEQVYGYSSYVDLPDDIDENDVDSMYEYVPGQGVYAIKNKTLIKYVRGKKISLGTLNAKGSLKGCELEDVRIPYLYFDEESEKLMLITGNLNSKTYYLYVFPDYNTSKLEYVAEIADWSVSGWAAYKKHEFHLYYTDLKGDKWVWSKKGPKRNK